MDMIPQLARFLTRLLSELDRRNRSLVSIVRLFEILQKPPSRLSNCSQSDVQT